MSSAQKCCYQVSKCIHRSEVNWITYLSHGVASLPHKCQPPLPSARQHLSYGDCLEVTREYYQNCSMLGCVTQCSQSAAHSYEQFLQVQQILFVTLGTYAMHRGGCLELYYCNMMEWFWWDSNLICQTNWLPSVL